MTVDTLPALGSQRQEDQSWRLILARLSYKVRHCLVSSKNNNNKYTDYRYTHTQSDGVILKALKTVKLYNMNIRLKTISKKSPCTVEEQPQALPSITHQ